MIGLLDVERIDAEIYRGSNPGQQSGRVFGGQIIAQALVSAGRTTSADLLPHSLHVYFLRPGIAGVPVLYQVSRDFDGRNFATRRVVAIQNGQPVLNLAASFHRREEGLHHQIAMPDLPGPEGLSDAHEEADTLRGRWSGSTDPADDTRPVIFRPVDPRRSFSADPAEPAQAFWFRAITPLSADRRLHRAVLAYASDMMFLSTSMLPHGIHWVQPGVQFASLDHSLWIHDEVDAGDWMLYVQDSPWTGNGRGMNRGSIFARDGRLIASSAQEALVRGPRGKEDGK